MIVEKRYLNIKNAAEYCGLSERYLFEQRRDKKIRHLKFGKKVMFDVKDLDIFMQSNAVEIQDWDKKAKELRG